MIYLSKKTTDFLLLSLKAAKENESKIFTFGKGKKRDNVLTLNFLKEDASGIHFSIAAGDVFEISILVFTNRLLPYKIKDLEFIGEAEVHTIKESELTSLQKHIRLLHFIVRSMVETITSSLIEYMQNPDAYKGELKEDSFRTIRLIYFSFMCNANKYCSWGVEYATLGEELVTIKVNGHHFKHLVQIKYNRGNDLFEILYLDSKTGAPMGKRTHVYVDELIDLIDKQVEYISKYENN